MGYTRCLLMLLGPIWGVCLALHCPDVAAQSFWDTLLRITGIAATPSQQKGHSAGPETGDIWISNLAQKTRQRVTHGGGYRSPVFLPDDASLLALQGEAVFQLPLSDNAPVRLYTVQGVTKLVGFHREDPDKVLILLTGADQQHAVGLLSITSGQVTPLPYDRQSEDAQRLYRHVQGWERVYGTTILYVQAQSPQGAAGAGEWTDVYRKHGDEAPANISKCDDAHCGQPSLSHDGRQVAFVKAARDSR
jgi:hypothetical protein